MKLVWTASAKRDLGDIISYIWADSAAAAKRLRNRIETTAVYLKSQAFMGRQGAVAGTREVVAHPSYRLVYQVSDDTIRILSVVHTSRQWPPVEGGG